MGIRFHKIRSNFLSFLKEILIITNTFDTINFFLRGKKKHSKSDFFSRQKNYKSLLKKISKSSNNEKIKIFIAVYDYSIWQVNSLFLSLLKNEKFDVGLVYIPFLKHYDDEFIVRYKKTLKFCKSKSENVIEVYDFENKKWKTENKFKSFEIDILIYTHTSNSPFEASSTGKYLLPFYIPYGIMAASNKSFFKAFKFENFQFNKNEHNFMFRNLLETDLHLKLKEKYSKIKSINSVVCGYPKLDDYYKIDSMTDPWKSNSKRFKKKIIWAPHFTISKILEKNKRETLRTSAVFSTFDLNMNFFLKYFSLNKDILFCYKPHPLLHKTIVETGFLSEDDFNSYLKKLLNLENVFEYDSPDYINLFSFSDALITDCVSFLSEYLPSKKPILFLENQFYSFNNYGKKLTENFYKSKGSNFYNIKFFIEEVVVMENDLMFKKRMETLKEIDLIRNEPSSKRIINYINELLYVS